MTRSRKPCRPYSDERIYKDRYRFRPGYPFHPARQGNHDEAPRLSGGMSSNFGAGWTSGTGVRRRSGDIREDPLPARYAYGTTMLTSAEKGPRLSGGMSSDFGAARDADHRGQGPRGYIRPDDRLFEEINERLMDDDLLDARRMKVVVAGAEVTLNGYVDSRQAKRRAGECAESISGVVHVQNNLRFSAGPGF